MSTREGGTPRAASQVMAAMASSASASGVGGPAYNIGDEGMKVFADAIGNGALPALNLLFVDAVARPQLLAVCQPRGIFVSSGMNPSF